MTTISQVQDAVCRRFGLTHEQLTGECRSRAVARPRQLAYLACQRLTGHSLKRIGNSFGNRDHATIHYGINETRRRVESDPTWAGHLACVEVLAR